jgi:hypothetical protein
MQCLWRFDSCPAQLLWLSLESSEPIVTKSALATVPTRTEPSGAWSSPSEASHRSDVSLIVGIVRTAGLEDRADASVVSIASDVATLRGRIERRSQTAIWFQLTKVKSLSLPHRRHQVPVPGKRDER